MTNDAISIRELRADCKDYFLFGSGNTFSLFAAVRDLRGMLPCTGYRYEDMASVVKKTGYLHSYSHLPLKFKEQEEKNRPPNQSHELQLKTCDNDTGRSKVFKERQAIFLERSRTLTQPIRRTLAACTRTRATETSTD